MTAKTFRTSQIITLLLLFGFINPSNAQLSVDKKNDLNNYIENITNGFKIYGGAVAILQNNKVVYQRYFGESNLETHTAINEQSIFPIFSTTKIFTAVAVHQLIEEQKINFEDRVSKYLNDLPQEWRNIKIKHCLSFSSGLPDINAYASTPIEIAQEKVYADTIHFAAGERFEYNQTNFWLLDRIVQKVTKQSIPDFIKSTQFAGSKNSVVYDGIYSNDIPNRATIYAGYGANGFTGKREVAEYRVGDFMHSSSGLNVSLDAFIKWAQAFNKGKFINDKTKRQLFTPFDYQVPHNFTYGWSIINVDGKPTYGFTGSGFTGYRIFPKQNISVILFTNGSLYQMPINGFMNRLAEIATTESDQSDEALITHTLNDYIEGSTNGQPARIKKAFHPDLNLYYVRNNEIRTWSGVAYIDDTKEGQPTGETGKILSIDYENNAAMAKVEISNPKSAMPYIDYFMLLKTDGKWTIVHKMFTKKRF